MKNLSEFYKNVINLSANFDNYYDNKTISEYISLEFNSYYGGKQKMIGWLTSNNKIYLKNPSCSNKMNKFLNEQIVKNSIDFDNYVNVEISIEKSLNMVKGQQGDDSFILHLMSLNNDEIKDEIENDYYIYAFCYDNDNGYFIQDFSNEEHDLFIRKNHDVRVFMNFFKDKSDFNIYGTLFYKIDREKNSMLFYLFYNEHNDDGELMHVRDFYSSCLGKISNELPIQEVPNIDEKYISEMNINKVIRSVNNNYNKLDGFILGYNINLLNKNSDGLNKAIANIETKINENSIVNDFELLFKMKLVNIKILYNNIIHKGGKKYTTIEDIETLCKSNINLINKIDLNDDSDFTFEKDLIKKKLKRFVPNIDENFMKEEYQEFLDIFIKNRDKENELGNEKDYILDYGNNLLLKYNDVIELYKDIKINNAPLETSEYMEDMKMVYNDIFLNEIVSNDYTINEDINLASNVSSVLLQPGKIIQRGGELPKFKEFNDKFDKRINEIKYNMVIPSYLISYGFKVRNRIKTYIELHHELKDTSLKMKEIYIFYYKLLNNIYSDLKNEYLQKLNKFNENTSSAIEDIDFNDVSGNKFLEKIYIINSTVELIMFVVNDLCGYFKPKKPELSVRTFFQVNEKDTHDMKLKRLIVLLSLNNYNNYFIYINQQHKQSENFLKENLFLFTSSINLSSIVISEDERKQPVPHDVFVSMNNMDVKDDLIESVKMLIKFKYKDGIQFDKINHELSYYNFSGPKILYSVLRPYIYFGLFENETIHDKIFGCIDDNGKKITQVDVELNKIKLIILNDETIPIFSGCNDVTIDNYIKCLDEMTPELYRVNVGIIGAKFMELFDNSIVKKYDVNSMPSDSDLELRQRFKYDIIENDFDKVDSNINVNDDILNVFTNFIRLDDFKELEPKFDYKLFDKSYNNIIDITSFPYSEKSYDDIVVNYEYFRNENDIDKLWDKIYQCQKITGIEEVYYNEIIILYEMAKYIFDFQFLVFTENNEVKRKCKTHTLEYYFNLRDNKGDLKFMYTRIKEMMKIDNVVENTDQVDYMLYNILKTKFSKKLKEERRIKKENVQEREYYDLLIELEHMIDISMIPKTGLEKSSYSINKSADDYNFDAPGENFPYNEITNSSYDNTTCSDKDNHGYNNYYTFENYVIKDEEFDNNLVYCLRGGGVPVSINNVSEYFPKFHNNNNNLQLYSDISRVKRLKNVGSSNCQIDLGFNSYSYRSDLQILRKDNDENVYHWGEAFINDFPYDKSHMDSVNLSEKKQKICHELKISSYSDFIINMNKVKDKDVGFSVEFEEEDDVNMINKLKDILQNAVINLNRIRELVHDAESKLHKWNYFCRENIFSIREHSDKFFILMIFWFLSRRERGIPTDSVIDKLESLNNKLNRSKAFEKDYDVVDISYIEYTLLQLFISDISKVYTDNYIGLFSLNDVQDGENEEIINFLYNNNNVILEDEECYRKVISVYEVYHFNSDERNEFIRDCINYILENSYDSDGTFILPGRYFGLKQVILNFDVKEDEDENQIFRFLADNIGGGKKGLFNPFTRKIRKKPRKKSCKLKR